MRAFGNALQQKWKEVVRQLTMGRFLSVVVRRPWASLRKTPGKYAGLHQLLSVNFYSSILTLLQLLKVLS